MSKGRETRTRLTQMEANIKNPSKCGPKYSSNRRLMPMTNIEITRKQTGNSRMLKLAFNVIITVISNESGGQGTVRWQNQRN